jgi:hypothetical protein
MTLLELHVDVSRMADALERIVTLLEKLIYPPPPAEVSVHQATLDDLHIVTPQDQERIQQEQAEFAERYRVVPGTPAMALALQWEAEQRSLYGQQWEKPDDWRAIFVAAEGGGQEGPVRASAETPTATAPSQ